MIIAIEGPDKSGKTTLLEPLAKALQATIVRRFSTPPELMAAMPHVEVLYLQLFGELYDPSKIYVCDRSPTLSAQVYSKVFDRPSYIDVAPWLGRQVIVYVKTHVNALMERHAKDGDDVFPVRLYERTVAEYEQRLKEYPAVIQVDGLWPPERNVTIIIQKLTALTH